MDLLVVPRTPTPRRARRSHARPSAEDVLGGEEEFTAEPLADDLSRVRLQPPPDEPPPPSAPDEPHNTEPEADPAVPGNPLHTLLQRVLAAVAELAQEAPAAPAAAQASARRGPVTWSPRVNRLARRGPPVRTPGEAADAELQATLDALQRGATAWLSRALPERPGPATLSAWSELLEMTLAEALPGLGDAAPLGGTTLLDLLVGGTELLAALMPEAAGDPRVRGADASTGRRTGVLLDQITRALGLDHGAVRVELTDTPLPGGGRGLRQGDQIWLDRAFDPSRREGATLLAHELVHVAQASLPAAAGPDAGLLAENEAAAWARGFAAGRAPSAPEIGLPAGHLAADPGDWGARVRAVQEVSDGLGMDGQPMEISGDRPDRTASSNEDRRLDDYQRGVDETFAKVGDLSAFETLCDAIDDEEDTQTALGAVRSTTAYRELCDIWQSAVDGDGLRCQMMERFDDEWSGRGFWAETEQAFGMVAAAAKRDARRSAEAQDALRQREQAESADVDIQEASEEARSAADERAAEAADTSVEAAMGELSEYLDAVVPQQAPPVAAFDDLRAVSDERLSAIEFERGHQIGLEEGFDTPSRWGQISDVLMDNLVGGFGKGFVDQGIDTLILDNLSSYGDKALTAATGGRLGATPFIGPALTLIKYGITSEDPIGGLNPFNNEKAGKHWEDMKAHFEAFQSAEGTDALGIALAMVADGLGWLVDVVSKVQEIVGILSALCYVVGAILLLVGLIPWLAFLLSIGAWLVRAGGILARVNTVLGRVLLILTPLELAFRTIAAFLVPAELYAEQLAATGDAANQFGEKAGAKIADETASKVKERISQPNQTTEGDPPVQPAEGRTQADADIARANDQADAILRTAQDDIEAGVTAKREADAEALEDGDAARPPGGQDPTARPGEQDPAAQGGAPPRKSLLREVGEGLLRSINPVDIAREIGSIRTDMGSINFLKNRDWQAGAAQAMPPRQLKAFLEAQLPRAQARLDEAESALAQLPAGHADRGRLESELQTLRNDIDGMRLSLADVTQRVSQGQTSGQGSADPLGRQRLQEQLAEERTRLQSQREQVETEITRLQEELTAARQREQEAADELQRLQQEQEGHEEHIRRHQEAQQHAQQATDLQRRIDTLQGDAAALRAQAQQVESGRTKRAEAESQRTDADEARTRADSLLAQMKARWGGKRLRVEVDDGSGGTQVSQRTVRRFEDDGVVVSDGRGEIKVPYDRVVTQVARGMGEDVMQQVGSHQQLRADAARLDQQANQLDPDRADPTELRAQAQGKSEQASELAPQLEQARQGSAYGGSGQSLADHQSAVGNLQQQQQAQQQSQTGAADEVTRLSGQLDGQRTALSDTDRALQSVDTRLANQQTQPQQGSEVDDYIFRHGHGGVSSGNAMGGVGSTAKDFWQWWNASGEDGDKNREAFSAFVQRLLDLSGRIGRLLSTPAPPAEPTQPTQPTIGPAPAPQGQQQGGQPQLSALGLVGMSPGGGSTGDWASYGLGELMGRQTQDEVRQAGALRANVERLIALQPPAVVDEMNAHRINAMRAMQRYVALHDDAWRAYQGELAINAVINDTHAVRDLGNPVIEAADEELVCIEEGQEEEQRRKAAIESMNTDTPGMEGGMAALVAELVIKMADHGDRMEDGSPNTGATSGEEVANAHTTASEESENQRDLAGQASDAQRAFLDEAVAAAGEQRGFAEQTMRDVDVKLATEERLREEVRVYKAQKLADAEAARLEAETESTAFNSDFSALEGWAQQYKAQREATFQMIGGQGADPAVVQEVAPAGIAQASSPLPFLQVLQPLFGEHDLSGVKAQVGGPAQVANDTMGAEAYASQGAVAFRDAPDLFEAAHEAAHVIQQRLGAQVPGGVGSAGDAWERHADAVAALVTQGQSAEALLSEAPGTGGGGAAGLVQHDLGEERELWRAHGDEAAAASRVGPEGFGWSPEPASATWSTRPRLALSRQVLQDAGWRRTSASMPQGEPAELLRACVESLRQALAQRAADEGHPLDPARVAAVPPTLTLRLHAPLRAAPATFFIPVGVTIAELLGHPELAEGSEAAAEAPAAEAPAAEASPVSDAPPGEPVAAPEAAEAPAQAVEAEVSPTSAEEDEAALGALTIVPPTPAEAAAEQDLSSSMSEEERHTLLQDLMGQVSEFIGLFQRTPARDRRGLTADWGPRLDQLRDRLGTAFSGSSAFVQLLRQWRRAQVYQRAILMRQALSSFLVRYEMRDLAAAVGIEALPSWDQPLEVESLDTSADPEGDAVIENSRLGLAPEIINGLRLQLGLRSAGGVLNRDLVRAIAARQGSGGTGVLDEDTFLDINPGRHLIGGRTRSARNAYLHEAPWSGWRQAELEPLLPDLIEALHAEPGSIRAHPRGGATPSGAFLQAVASWQAWKFGTPEGIDCRLTAADLRELGLSPPGPDPEAAPEAAEAPAAEAAPVATTDTGTPEPVDPEELARQELEARRDYAANAALGAATRFFTDRRRAGMDAGRDLRGEARAAARREAYAAFDTAHDAALLGLYHDLQGVFDSDASFNTFFQTFEQTRTSVNRWRLMQSALNAWVAGESPQVALGTPGRTDPDMVYAHNHAWQPVDATVRSADATLEAEGLLLDRRELVREGWNPRLLSAGGATHPDVSTLAEGAIAGIDELLPTISRAVSNLNAAITTMTSARGDDRAAAEESLRSVLFQAISSIPHTLPTLVRRQITVDFPDREIPPDTRRMQALAVSWRNTLRGLQRDLNAARGRQRGYTDRNHAARNPNAVIVDLNRTGVDVAWNTGAAVPLREMQLDPVFALAMVRFLEAIRALGVRKMWTSGFLRTSMSAADTHPYGQACDITGFEIGGDLIHLRSGYPVAPPEGVDPNEVDASSDYMNTRTGHSDWFDERQTTSGRTHREIMMAIAALMTQYFGRIVGPGANAEHMGHFHVELYGGNAAGALLALTNYADMEQLDWLSRRADRTDPGWAGEPTDDSASGGLPVGDAID